MERMPMAEKIEFPNGCPCRVRTRKNVTHEIGLPHYAPTVELVLTRGVKGVVSVGARQFVTNGEDSAFFIPPQTVHYTEFERGDGSIHVFKLSPELLKDYMDLDKLLETKGTTLPSSLLDESYVIDRREEVAEYLMLRLRLRKGISTDDFRARFGADFDEIFGKKLEIYIKNGLMTHEDGHYAFTPQGMFVSNEILSRIIPFETKFEKGGKNS